MSGIRGLTEQESLRLLDILAVRMFSAGAPTIENAVEQVDRYVTGKFHGEPHIQSPKSRISHDDLLLRRPPRPLITLALITSADSTPGKPSETCAAERHGDIAATAKVQCGGSRAIYYVRFK